jgi:hypothetical protein
VAWWDHPPEASVALRLAITLDVSSGGYLVELSTPELWPLDNGVYSQTLIPFEAESDQSDAQLDALLTMHMKFLGFT